MTTPGTLPDDLAGIRVLVADDSESARKLLSSMLQREGMDVTVAADGPEVLSIVDGDPQGFAIILIDLFMDRLDGIETMQRLRPLLHGRACAIVPMSATFSEEIEAQCRAAGATGMLLRKPYRHKNVMAVVRSALGIGAAAPAPSVPERAALRAVPAMPGCDVSGALERCGNDASLLRDLVLRYRTEGPGAITEVLEALSREDFNTARKRTHKLRGDLSNLGLVSLGERLHRLERQLHNEASIVASSATALKTTNFARTTRSYFHDQFATIGAELKQILQAYAAVPTLGAPPIEGGLLPQEQDRPSELCNLHALVHLLKANATSALAFARANGVWLPAGYGEATQADFRRRVEDLDFRGALSLLQTEDLPPPTGGEVATDATRILLVDDAVVSIKLLSSALDGVGTLRFALNAQDALAIALDWNPDLILIDVNLGRSSGIELCRELKSNPHTADCVVILISADSEISAEIDGLTAGAIDFLEKPINPTRVSARVRAHISNARNRLSADRPLTGSASTALLGYIVSTPEGLIKDITPTLANHLGKLPREYIGASLARLFDTVEVSALDAALKKCRETSRSTLECVLINSDGLHTPVRLVGRQVAAGDEMIIWFGVEDIREQVSKERKRIEQQVSESLVTISAGIAHEFNNLLGIVIGNVDIALEAEIPEPAQRSLRRASEAALRAADISRTLSESAMRSHGTADKPEQLDRLIENIWPLLSKAVPATATLIRSGDSGMAEVRVSAAELRQVLARLIANACEAMPGGGQITLSTRSETRTGDAGPPRELAIVEISDTGAGMEEQILARAFDPFFTTKMPGHTGLGLSEVSAFASRNGGDVELRSYPGLGTTVRLALPAV